jgi:hypothetical protein
MFDRAGKRLPATYQNPFWSLQTSRIRSDIEKQIIALETFEWSEYIPMISEQRISLIDYVLLTIAIISMYYMKI